MIHHLSPFSSIQCVLNAVQCEMQQKHANQYRFYFSMHAGDDEQSDWFFEGDCGVGTGMASLLPTWDSDNLLSLKDKRTSLSFLKPVQYCRLWDSRDMVSFLVGFIIFCSLVV